MSAKNGNVPPTEGGGASGRSLATESAPIEGISKRDVINACIKIKDELIRDGYIAVYDSRFAEMIAEELVGGDAEEEKIEEISEWLEHEMLYDEDVVRKCGYERFVDPAGDILLFVADIDEIVDMLKSKDVVKLLW